MNAPRLLTIYSHRACIDHDMGEYHPESPRRLETILAMIEAEYPAILDCTLSPADTDLFKTIHDPAYIDRLIAIDHQLDGTKDRHRIDSDTIMEAGTLRATRMAAGAVMKACANIMTGQTRHAFCATRPPGHHAEYDRAMGFCFVNHAFLAAVTLIDGAHDTQHDEQQHPAPKVAIIDFDVHHGNGTADLTRRRAESGLRDVLYISSHEHPLYPGTGIPAIDGDAHGCVLDLPYPAAMESSDFIALYERSVLPALLRFAPDYLVVSAGFDAHRDDPLSTARLNEDTFAAITTMLKNLRKPILSILEGGYNLEALENSVQAHIEALLGEG